MRWVVLGLVMLPLAGEAKPEPPPPPARDPSYSRFWSEVVEPNGKQVAAILDRVDKLLQQPDAALQSDTDWAVDQRQHYFDDALGLLQSARALSPRNAEVLAQLGRVADELGKTREAIEALEASIRITGPENVSKVTGRLGAIYLRLGQLDPAIRWLRFAQGPLNPITAHSLVHLANALALRGEMIPAIETLSNALPSHALGYYQEDVTLASFALAVIYDRDEQRGAAFDVLANLQTTLQQQYANQLQIQLAKMRFAPAEDQHYYQALLYESQGHYIEARAEWALYAASGDTPWRPRALGHIAAIDAQRRTLRGVRPEKAVSSPGLQLNLPQGTP
ncbi:MAG: tetratricopeptide repeat protein [Kofleriaceae bacterium]